MDRSGGSLKSSGLGDGQTQEWEPVRQQGSTIPKAFRP